MNQIYRQLLPVALLFSLLACSRVETSEHTQTTVKYVENQEILKKGMGEIKGLIGGHLKPALSSAMKEDKSGLKGMKMCSTTATSLEKSYNETLPKGSHVRRTALKYRNPDNKPDQTDVAVMTKLKDDKNFKPVVVEMDNHFRVYKAIPIKKPCLACHGEKKSINQDVQKIITEKYPKDLATEFKEGEFRGVVVAEIQK